MASSDSAARRAERRARRKAKRAGGQVPVAAPLPVAPPVVAPVESFSPEAALVEDATAVPLPSFDDFRRRDAEAAAAVARSDLPAASTRDGFGWGADGPLNGGGGGAPAVLAAAAAAAVSDDGLHAARLTCWPRSSVGACPSACAATGQPCNRSSEVEGAQG